MLTKTRDAIFGKPKTIKDYQREYSRLINRTVKDLDFEIQKISQREVEKKATIRKYAKQGMHDYAKQVSGEISRGRACGRRYLATISQLNAINDTLMIAVSQQNIFTAMRGAARVMKAVNIGVNINTTINTMHLLEREMSTLNTKGEMMNDAIDSLDVSGTDNESDTIETADQIYKQICDEIGLTYEAQMTSAPSTNPSMKTDELILALNTLQPPNSKLEDPNKNDK